MRAINKRGFGFRGRIRRSCAAVIILLVCAFISFSHFDAEGAFTGINDTVHNLSASGPGPIKSSTETRICVFCHTPHDAYRLSGTSGSGPVAPPEYTYLPLWNHEVTTTPEKALYWSSTMKATLSQPTGPTKLCLSCHDGTIAIGAVASGANLGITLALQNYTPPPGGPNPDIGTDLSTHHPVSFPYSASLPNPELQSVDGLPSVIRNGLSGNNEVHCTTCHDPHDDSNGNFLVMDNSSSQLCEACHLLTGWDVSAHNQCADCHTPHFASGPDPDFPGEWLLKFSSYDGCFAAGCHTDNGSTPPIPHLSDASGSSGNAQAGPEVFRSTGMPAADTGHQGEVCDGCHSEKAAAATLVAGLSGSVEAKLGIPESPAMPTVDIKRQMEKLSSHRTPFGARVLSQRQQLAARRSGQNQVTCVGCHNPHSVSDKKARAPYVPGMLQGVSGVDRNGNDVASANYEYEICFKCHSDYSSDVAYVPRVVNSTNTRLAFDTNNPSYHPVVGIGKAQMVPSIPSPLNPTLTASSMIYCTDCHRDDENGSRGPHGSSFSPILGEEYEMVDGTPESYQSYALCYRCHNRDSILRDDSFKKDFYGKGGHSGHLAAGATCSACHDPHGVNSPMSGDTGSHAHLINFDTRVVLPVQGNPYPIYTDRGMFSGSCTLVCHGKVHNNLSYP